MGSWIDFCINEYGEKMNPKEIDTQVAEILKYKMLKRRLDENLRKHGPKLIQEALSRMSMRALARRVGLSSTYLSRVNTSQVVLSKESFLRIAKELR
jgi:hypothetical protein